MCTVCTYAGLADSQGTFRGKARRVMPMYVYRDRYYSHEQSTVPPCLTANGSRHALVREQIWSASPLTAHSHHDRELRRVISLPRRYSTVKVYVLDCVSAQKDDPMSRLTQLRKQGG